MRRAAVSLGDVAEGDQTLVQRPQDRLCEGGGARYRAGECREIAGRFRERGVQGECRESAGRVQGECRESARRVQGECSALRLPRRGVRRSTARRRAAASRTTAAAAAPARAPVGVSPAAPLRPPPKGREGKLLHTCEVVGQGPG